LSPQRNGTESGLLRDPFHLPEPDAGCTRIDLGLAARVGDRGFARLIERF
jgi:hypothetical protein